MHTTYTHAVEFKKLIFKKQGFKDKTKVAYPQNNEPLDVVLEK